MRLIKLCFICCVVWLTIINAAEENIEEEKKPILKREITILKSGEIFIKPLTDEQNQILANLANNEKYEEQLVFNIAELMQNEKKFIKDKQPKKGLFSKLFGCGE